MSNTGSCLCGAVKYTLKHAPTDCGACHCSMCRKWTGGAFIAFLAPAGDVSFDGAEHLRVFKSSEWAERASCAKCGSSLFYRVTAPGPEQGTYHIGLGTLVAADSVVMKQEIFIDEKPTGYAFAGDTSKMTGAEVFAMFAPTD